MSRQIWATKCGFIAATLAGALSACSSPGDLAITNESAVDVTVLIEGEATEVSAGGGVVLLDSGCTTGDVTIEYSSGRTIVVSGPICPEQEIVVHNDVVDLRP